MKLPKWTRSVEWLQAISTNPLFEKIMLANILKYEDECKFIINSKITPYFENLQKGSSEKHILLTILSGLMIEVDIYISQDGRKHIKEARNKLKNAADTAEKLANQLNEIKNYANDSLVFAFPDSLEKLLERQGCFYIDGIENADIEILLKDMATNLMVTPVGTPTLEWVDDHNASSDLMNVVIRALERTIDPPNGIITAFIFLCFGVSIEESTVQKFNSPARKKIYKPDIRPIKF